jgi:regulatory protein
MKKFTTTQIKEKIRHYCAYQERSHLEVRSRLFDYGLYSSEVDELISDLISEGFLNEERYAKAFAGGKFRIKKWGRVKIVNDLENSGISKNCIKVALTEIDESDYHKTLQGILQKKVESLPGENMFVKRDKIAKYAIQKGFEPELVWKQLKELLPN